MARSWQAPQLLVVILVALVAITYQSRKKTFVSVREVPASEIYVAPTLQFVTSEFNKQSDDQYSFRIVRVLNVKKLVTNHMEYHLNLEIRRTTCSRLETGNCTFQEGELYKEDRPLWFFPGKMMNSMKKIEDTVNLEDVIDVTYLIDGQIECFYSVFVVPWFEKYKILNQNCTNG